MGLGLGREITGEGMGACWGLPRADWWASQITGLSLQPCFSPPLNSELGAVEKATSISSYGGGENRMAMRGSQEKSPEAVSQWKSTLGFVKRLAVSCWWWTGLWVSPMAAFLFPNTTLHREQHNRMAASVPPPTSLPFSPACSELLGHLPDSPLPSLGWKQTRKKNSLKLPLIHH